MSSRMKHQVSEAYPGEVPPQPAMIANPDADLLAMIPEYDRRIAASAAYEADPTTWDAKISDDMDDFAAAVLTMPPAQTPAGRAFKARAALHDWSYVADEGDGAAETRIGRFFREIADEGGAVAMVSEAQSKASSSTAEQAARPARGSHPDAALLSACAAYDALQHEWLEAFIAGTADLAKEHEAEAECDRIYDRQDEPFQALMAAPCTTLEGVQAIAASLALWKPEVLSVDRGLVEDQLTAKLVNALLDMRQANPDAELIAASDKFCQVMDRIEARVSDAPPGSDEEAADLQVQDMEFAVARGIAERMVHMRAVTPAGLAARAVALGRADPDHAMDYDAWGTMTRLLLDPLLRDGATLAAARGTTLRGGE